MEIDRKKFWAALNKIVAEDKIYKNEEKEEDLYLKFNLERYKLAGSFEKALDIFFKDVIDAFDAINKISYNLAIASITNLKSENDVKDTIKKFVIRVYDNNFVYWLQTFTEIVKIYPSSLEEKQKILKQKEHHISDLKLGIREINETAGTLLKWGKHYKLDKLPEFSEYMEQLNTLATIEVRQFFVVLKATLKGDTTVDKHMIEDLLSKA